MPSMTSQARAGYSNSLIKVGISFNGSHSYLRCALCLCVELFHTKAESSGFNVNVEKPTCVAYYTPA